MKHPVLCIFAGLPGVGKSTLAQQLAARLGCAYVRIDTIEQALRDLCAVSVEAEGYRLAYRVAADNLKVGISVVADCCNPIGITRTEWENVARNQGADFVNIEIFCSDEAEHRRRVETRISDIQGHRCPNWQQVKEREYETWDRYRIAIDTFDRTIEACVEELLARIQKREEGQVSQHKVWKVACRFSGTCRSSQPVRQLLRNNAMKTKPNTPGSWRNFPSDLFLPLSLSFVMGLALLLTWLFGLQGGQWLVAFGGALAVASVGAGFLFLAKLPLYRKGVFWVLGTADLPKKSRVAYRWGIGLGVAGCGTAALLVATLASRRPIVTPPASVSREIVPTRTGSLFGSQ